MAKSKAKKIFKIGLISGFVLIAALVVIIPLFYGTIITSSVEKILPRVIGASVSVSRLTLSPFTGHGSIGVVKVGNPKGFDSEFSMKLNSFDIRLEPKSVLEDIIVIDRITIQGPEITSETNKVGNNLKVLNQNAQSYGSSPSKNTEVEKSQKDKKVVINHLLIQGAKVNWRPRLGLGSEVTLSLPDIHLKDIGKTANGASLSQVLARVLQEINKATFLALKSQGNAVVDSAKEQLKVTGKSLKNIF